MTSALQTLETRIPPVLVTILWADLMLGLSALNPLPFSRNSFAVLLAIVTTLAGIGLILAGVLSFRKAQTTVNPHTPENSSELVQSGIYAFTRNPMYVGFFLLLIGWGFVLADVLALLSSYGFVMYMNRFQIAPEERMLEKTFDTEYLLYRSRVRRWLWKDSQQPL